jgi:hypothetical protein
LILLKSLTNFVAQWGTPLPPKKPIKRLILFIFISRMGFCGHSDSQFLFVALMTLANRHWLDPDSIRRVRGDRRKGQLPW